MPDWSFVLAEGVFRFMKNALLEGIYADSPSITILIHGLGGRKEEWLESDGYTKGGHIIEALSKAGLSWLACDLYGHGSWTAEEQGFDPENIPDKLWDSFMERSIAHAAETLRSRISGGTMRHVNMITYSAGCLVGAKLLETELPLPFDTVHMASPVPQKAYDDEYSLHNNLAGFRGLRYFQYSGQLDQESDPEESGWFFRQVQAREKRLHWYQSEHSLPREWTSDALRNTGI